MFSPAQEQDEAGPSTRSLRSRSPIKPITTATRLSRFSPLLTASSSPILERPLDLDQEDVIHTTGQQGYDRPSSSASTMNDQLASSETLQSPETHTVKPEARRKRTYSRRSTPSSLAPNGTHHSRSSSPLSSPTKTPLGTTSSTRKSKGKGRAKPAGSISAPRAPRGDRKPAPVAEKRVLPARIRRAAGTGAEGIRDLEEMIVDWLERCGEPIETPPDSLTLHLTTIPASHVEPPVSSITFVNHTIAPSLPNLSTSAEPKPSGGRERIEVPSWVFVKAGDDDEEEAKNEIQTSNYQRTQGNRAGSSPVKRLRHATAETPLEDTSDAYYISLHKKYEVFERRQRIREKETLQFERYKMRSRIDLLRGMSKTAWAAVVGVVLSRTALRVAPVPVPKVGKGEIDPAAIQDVTGKAEKVDGEDRWAKGRVKLEGEGADWLRDTLVKEGEEVMRRYDELLPVEHRKIRTNDSPAPTTSYSHSPSLSPPPVVSHRVAALRDTTSTSAPRRRARSPVHTPLIPTTTPKRIRLTIKPKSVPARQSADPTDPDFASHSQPRKRKRISDITGISSSDRQTRSTNLKNLPEPTQTSRRQRSPLQSQSLQADEVILGSEATVSGDEEGEESGYDGATEVKAKAIPQNVLRLRAPPISIRISRSSARLSGEGPKEGVGEMTVDEARELREVEAAVL